MYKSIQLPALRKIRITDDLFCHYVALVAEKIIPYQWEKLNDRGNDDSPASHCVENFRRAAEGQGPHEGAVFCDSDGYKWLEALSYCLENGMAKEFEVVADDFIELIGKAQLPDGYLNTYYSLSHPDKKWSNLAEGHELYCAGHLIEAAVAYYQATNKDALLKIAMRLSDLIYSRFVVQGNPGYPGHEEIELALVRLYHVTDNKDYLDLARHFLKVRGKQPSYLMEEMQHTAKDRLFPEFRDYDAPYAQSDTEPVNLQTAEGHAVRVMYLCSGMADVAREYDDRELAEACQRLWKNVTEQRMYITGGVGSSGHLERFTTDYDLPNDDMYCESCASVGLMRFGQRMNLLTHDAKYYDIVEKALCNIVLAGISKNGDRYFYVNPQEVWPANCLPGTSMAHVKPIRQPWYDVACCPTNIARTLASLGQFIYAEDHESIYIHQLISSTLQTNINKCNVSLVMNSFLYERGSVSLTINCTDECRFKLRIRIPNYIHELIIQQDGIDIDPQFENGYAVIDLNGSHAVKLFGKVRPEFVGADDKVRADLGRIALKYGPFIYCLEEMDNRDNLAALYVDPEAEISKGLPKEDLPGAMPELHFTGKRLTNSMNNELYGAPAFKLAEEKVSAIPYALWGNRTPGEMLIWLKAIVK